jgi:hypothetical protein
VGASDGGRSNHPTIALIYDFEARVAPLYAMGNGKSQIPHAGEGLIGLAAALAARPSEAFRLRIAVVISPR